MLLSVFVGSCSHRILTADERRLAAEDGIRLDLMGRGVLDSDWMVRTRCYEVSNSLIKSCARKHKIVYSIVPKHRYEVLLVLWYFNQTYRGENQINIITVDNRGDKKMYRRNYPFSLQWLWNIKDHDWPDSLLIADRGDIRHPKNFLNISGMPIIPRDDKAVVYDSTFINIYMPTYSILEKFGAELDSLSPIYRTYHESYEHFVYPIVDSLMKKESRSEIYWWKGVYAE